MSHVNTFMSLLNSGFSWYILIGTTGFIAPLWNRIPRKMKKSFLWSPVQTLGQFSPSVMSDSLRPHGLQHARPPCPSPTPGVYPIHVHWVSDAIQPSHPLRWFFSSSPSPPALNLSHHQVFSNELALCIRWPKCWSFSFNISPPSFQFSSVQSLSRVRLFATPWIAAC